MSISGITGLGSGIDYMVMQSSRDADKLINEFVRQIELGNDPNAVSAQVCSTCHVDLDDLTEYDYARVQRKVEEAYRSKHS